MSKTHHVAMAVLIASLAGCSTLSVTTDFDPKADFSRAKTYDWEWGKQKQTGDPRIDNAILDKRIRHIVDEELKARGYAQDTSGAATYLVGYHAAIRNELSVTHVNDYYGYQSAWQGSYVDVDAYEKGSIILDIVDARSGELIWRGWAEDTVEEGRSPEKSEANIRNAVKKMLERFPPQKKK